jgi:hypothetical protein
MFTHAHARLNKLAAGTPTPVGAGRGVVADAIQSGELRRQGVDLAGRLV